MFHISICFQSNRRHGGCVYDLSDDLTDSLDPLYEVKRCQAASNPPSLLVWVTIPSHSGSSTLVPDTANSGMVTSILVDDGTQNGPSTAPMHPPGGGKCPPMCSSGTPHMHSHLSTFGPWSHRVDAVHKVWLDEGHHGLQAQDGLKDHGWLHVHHLHQTSQLVRLCSVKAANWHSPGSNSLGFTNLRTVSGTPVHDTRRA